MGLESRLSLSLIGAGRGLTLEEFAGLPPDMTQPQYSDVLARDHIRAYEIAAIAPDAFDVTYYSIDPDYYLNYIAPYISNLGAPFPLRGDVGSTVNSKPFSISSQIETRNQIPGYRGDIFSFNVSRAPAQLLTSWTQSATNNYDFPEDRFAKCDDNSHKKVMSMQQKGVAVPGSCVVGGRTGYSVKLVSKDFLTQSDLDVGNSDPGPIKNPPPSGF